jgi:hypothetical protein
MAKRRNDLRHPEDAIEMLRIDHEKVRELFRAYEAAREQTAKRRLAEQAFIELELHAQLEETVFYPAFEQKADAEGKQLVAESLHEHRTVKDLIEELRELGPEAPEFEAKFQELMENVEHHVEEEENEMLPEAEEALAEQAEDLMDEMQELKKHLMTS